MSENDESEGHFDQLTYEEVAGFVQQPVFRLATAHLTAKENFPSDIFHLRFTLACGTGKLTGADCQYNVNIRQCVIDLKVTGCVADIANGYSYELSDSDVSEVETIDSDRDNSTDAVGGIKADVKLGFFQRISVALYGSAERKVSNKTQTQNKKNKKRRIMLVGCHGDHWIVGDDIDGDPRNENGYLRERYFNENREKDLCAFSFNKDVDIAIVQLAVRVKIGQLAVDIVDVDGTPSMRATGSQKEMALRALKERLRGIAIGRWINEDQRQKNYGLPLDEVVVAIAGIKAVRTQK